MIFSAVLGALLAGFGAGRLWRSRIARRGAYVVLGCLLTLFSHRQNWIPALFTLATDFIGAHSAEVLLRGGGGSIPVTGLPLPGYFPTIDLP